MTADPDPRPGRTRRRRFARRVLAAVVALAVVGAVTQTVSERRDARAHPPPGVLVDVGEGRKIHLDAAGVEHDGPTVVLEAGSSWYSSWWAWVQPAVAEHATVVSYDRAGLGWSVPPPGPFSSERAVADLHTALDAAGFEGPYVLVGSSLGGLLVRTFADAYPDEAAGLVLVDPSHERQLDEIPGYGAMHAMWTGMLRLTQAAASVGLLRLYYPAVGAAIDDLPDSHRAALRAQTATPAYIRASISDHQSLLAVIEDVRAIATLPDVPPRVVSADADPASQRLHADLVRQANRGDHHVVAGSDHWSILTQQSHAEQVSDAIVDLVHVIAEQERRR